MTKGQKAAIFFVGYYELMALPLELNNLLPIWLCQIFVAIGTVFTLLVVSNGLLDNDGHSDI
jgi:hypothetical protein